jgi:hypothetical protein
MLAQALCAEAGVCLPDWSNLVCRIMIVILPASLSAQDTNRGLVYSDGGTWLNEVQAPAVAAIFPDSLVQTQAGHVARIEVEGSSILVEPDTMVQFQGHELVLDHGSLQVNTATGVEVIVGCVEISPMKEERTQFEVTDAAGKIHVTASKKDVKIHAHEEVFRKAKEGASDTVVHEGGQATRSERCGPGPDSSRGATPGPILDSPWAVGAGLVVAGTLICLGLCHSSAPISPDKP